MKQQQIRIRSIDQLSQTFKVIQIVERNPDPKTNRNYPPHEQAQACGKMSLESHP